MEDGRWSFRSDEIGEAPVRCSIFLRNLLAQEMKPSQNIRPRFVGVEFHVIADAIGQEESVNASRLKRSAFDDPRQQLLRISEQLARFLAVLRMIENRRIASAQFPRVKER